DPEEDPHSRVTLRRPRGDAAVLLAALRRFEEVGELLETLRTEVLERRHRRTGVHARRARKVPNLEVDALVLRTLGREVGRTRGAAADPLVRVAVRAADHREQVRAGDRLRVVLESLLLRPGRNERLELAAERFVRGRALVREN